MSVIGGDFIGFTFDNIHSSELGIIRISEGSRFNYNLLPNIQDKTIQVPGGDGAYYFGSYYTQRQFTIPIAFDSLTEEQLVKLSRIFGDKNFHKLIFDESPYKYYMVKIFGTPQLKTVCFEINSQRVYKGEGTLQFIAYYPFAKSVYKYLDEYDDILYPSKNEWAVASRMAKKTDSLTNIVNGQIEIYNAGDQITYPKINYRLTAKALNINLSFNNNFLKMNIPAAEGRSAVIEIDMQSNIVSDTKGILYNQYITDGSFFGIEPTKENENTKFLICGNNCLSVSYDYIYY